MTAAVKRNLDTSNSKNHWKIYGFFSLLFQLIIFLLSVFFVRSKIIRVGDEFIADFRLVEGNKRIKSNCIGNFTQVSLRKCIYKCIRNKSCQTFNHHEGEQICEILNISKFDQVGLLEYSRGWNHYETDCNERNIGTACKHVGVCKEYEACEDTFDKKVYKCRCQDGFNGPKCNHYIGRGSSETNPAPACSLIIFKYTTLPDGYYWIKKKNEQKVIEKYCRRKGTDEQLFWTQWGYCNYDGVQTRKRQCHDPRVKDPVMRNCDDEIANRTCTHIPVYSCYKIKISNPDIKSGLFKLTRNTNGPREVYCDMDKGRVVTSCKDIKRINPSVKSGLFTISSKDFERINVYCDMETGQGGWMLIGHVVNEKDLSLGEAKDLISTIRSTDIKELYKAQNGPFLFDAAYLHNLTNDISQIRFYCHKNGKTIHIYTTSKNVVDFFLNEKATISDRPSACGTFVKFKDDDAYLTDHCAEWHDGKWGVYRTRISDVYGFPFFIEHKNHFGFFEGWFTCDDKTSNDRKGVWKVYVR